MDRLARLAAALALVAAACIASFFVARGTRKPFSMAAPSFRVLGSETSHITIVEFSDFECPACRQAEPTLRNIMKLYDGRVRLVFKHFPLRMHRWARSAAIAAECAGRQGRFWDYHHLLYDRQEIWVQGQTLETLESYAAELKLDLPSWRTCRQDPNIESAISADFQDGMNAWVGSTPTFFINGKRFVGAIQLSERGISFIDKELKK